MRLFVGVTDRDWYEHLRRIPGIDEVNFWKPSGNTGFHALSPGEPFLFKLHSPDDYIVGGGHLTVTPEYEFKVSGRLKPRFDNGEPCYPLFG